MLSLHPTSRVLFAWTDTTGTDDFVLRAISDGRTLELHDGVYDAFARLTGLLPWLTADANLPLPVCAYAVIVESEPASRWIRSGYALHPNADDIARLDHEFRTISTTLAGATAAPLLASLGTRGMHRINLSLYAGTAACDGGDIPLSDGEFGIVATIALARRVIGREELCDRLWPDRDPESSARLLKVYVHRIRAKVGTASVIDTRGGGYSLSDGVVVDVHDMEGLVRGINASPSPLDATRRERMERALTEIAQRGYGRLAVLEAFGEIERRFLAAGAEFARILVEDALAAKDSIRAMAIAEEFAANDPSDENAVELLIRTQLHLGRREAASRHFRTFCRTLRADFDLPPPPHLSLLLQA